MSKTLRLSPIAAAALSLHALPAFAADDPAAATTLPTVRVEDSVERAIKPEVLSSPKFTQPIVDTTQTVTVIKKELMQQQGSLSLADALRQTPGITFLQGENGNSTSGDAISMRGFDTQGSLFIDGIRDISPASRDLFNLEQIEIVKGPSGADFGRGAASGYINLQTKLPFAENAISGTAAYGSASRRRLTADVNRSLGERVAVRLNVMGQDGGVAGRDEVEYQQWSIAPSIAFGLGTDTRVALYSQHLFQDNVPDGGVTAVGVSGWRNATLDEAGIVAAPVDPSNFYGLDSDFEDVAVNTFTGRIDHEFNADYSVSNIARYSRVSQQRILTAPIQPPTLTDINDPSTWTTGRSRQGIDRDNELLTNQTNFRGRLQTGLLRHEFTSGVEFIQESQVTPTIAVTVTDPAQVQQRANTYAPDPADPGVLLSPSGASSRGQTTTGAVYFFDTAKFGERDQFQLNGGLRVERYRTESDLVSLSTTAARPDLPVGTPLGSRLEASGTLLTWKAGGLYKPTENGSLYVGYGVSRRPPGGDNFVLSANTANINSPTQDPSEAASVELGTKWELFERRALATATVFRTESENELSRQVDDTVVQYGKTRVQGVELGLVGNITERWQVSLGYALQDAEIAEGVIATDGTSTQSGAVSRFTPKHSLTTWTSYRVPVAIGPLSGPLTIGGGVRYQSTQARTVNNNPDAITAGIVGIEDFVVADAVVGYAVSPKIDVQANVYNLFDERYLASVNNAGQRYQPSIPRSFLLSLNVRY